MSSIPYRASIDGLRGLAVLGVLLFHLDSSFLPGGFVGVDVFFVLSGYLITSILLSEVQAEQFSISRFFQRRIARIIPAFYVVLLAVIIAGYFLYTPQDFASIGAVATASAFSMANMKLMLQGNYFEVSPDAQPLLHFWSLSVEEQFYLIYPLFFAFAASQHWSISKIRAALCIVMLMSFGLCLYMTNWKPTWAFYLLPTRAWELLLGSILATYSGNAAIAKYRSSVRLLGLCGLFASYIGIHESNAFPGWIACLPVFSTVLILIEPRNQLDLTERLLLLPLLIQTGKISYSLYLWHWPVFCFVDYHFFSSSPQLRIILKIVITIVASISCYHWIELPFRKRLNYPTTSGLSVSIAVCLIAVAALIGIEIRRNNYLNSNERDAASGGIVINDNIDSPVIVLMGDSLGSMYGKVVKEFALKLHARAHILSSAGDDPLPESQLYKNSLRFLEQNRPKIIILSVAWSQKGGPDFQRISTAVEELAKRADYIILITQPPILPEYASREQFRKTGYHSVVEEEASKKHRVAANDFVISCQNSKVRVVDVERIFVDPSGSIRFVDNDGKQLFHDRTHLSGIGSDLVGDLLIEQIKALLPKVNSLEYISPNSSGTRNAAGMSDTMSQ